MCPRLLSLAFVLSGSLLAAAEPVSVEKFAAGAAFSQARLSPDGNFFAFIQETEKGPRLTITDLKTKEIRMVNPGEIEGLPKEIPSYRWIGDRRLSFITTVWDGTRYTGVTAVDRDGERWMSYSGPDASPGDENPLLATRIIYAFNDDRQHVLMLHSGLNRGKDLLFPDVIKVDTLTGGGAYETVVENPGNVIGWAADRQGNVRLGVTRAERRYGAIYRDSGATPWRKLPLFDERLGRVEPMGLDFDGKRLVVVATNANQRRALYFYDVERGELGEAIAAHDQFDIIPERGSPSVEGVSLASVITSELTQAVVGVRYMTDGPKVQWFHPGLVAVQAAVDKALPKTVNLITSRSRDEKRMLILAFSDRDPGKYYLLDLQNGKPVVSLLGAQVADFPVERMAPMFPITYAARDGEKIHGYLTLPPGGKKKGLPLVVLPHGGPNVRDVWGYDPTVQFLAGRGYAVLQMNYRGSPGYGTEFYDLGKRQIGRAIQTDIEDGTRWAIAQGFADPARIAIVGASYGGYSALFALGKSPGLYRCGISIAGVTDWAEIFNGRKGEEYKFAFMHFQDWIGDPKIDAGFLASISPVNFAGEIKVPVFIVQGKEDRTVPPKQARRMAEALEASGNKPQTLYFSGEGHGFRKEKNRVKLLREMEVFLAKNLAPASGG